MGIKLTRRGEEKENDSEEHIQIERVKGKMLGVSKL